MAYWYVNFGDGATTGYYAIPRWSTGTAKTVGQFVRQNTTPTVGNERCFVCIAAGTTNATTEPTWVLTAGARTNDGTVTWMECSGRAGTNGSLLYTTAWITTLGAVVLGTQIKGTATATTTLFICTTAGTVGVTEPTWNTTIGATTTDGTAVWTCLGPGANYSAWQTPVARYNILQATANSLRTTGADVIFVADNHAETSSAATTISFFLAPSHTYCMDHTIASPTGANLKNTGSITTTGATALSITGNGYINGLVFNVGVGNASATQARLQLQLAVTGYMTLENCRFFIASTASTAISAVNFGNANPINGFVNLINCSVQLLANTSIISLTGGVGYWKNSSLFIPGGVMPPVLISSVNALGYGSLVFEGVDFTGFTGTLIDSLANGSKISLIKCKLDPALVATTGPQIEGNWEVELTNCDSGTGYYRNERWNAAGKLTTEIGVIRVGGTTDGATPISWKIITTNFSDWGTPFVSFPISVYNTAIGSGISVTIEVLTDGVTLTNADIWLEASYFGSRSATLRSFVNSGLINGLDTPVNLATSAATWNTTGLVSPMPQKILLTFTPQVIGFVLYRVRIGRINTTVYVDPKIT
jgi:hypothetical protein